MVYISKEMKRQDFETPLLIGGATTSSKHTSIKIAPEYQNTTIRVKDASRVSHIVGDLLNSERKLKLDLKIKREQLIQREAYHNKDKNIISVSKDALIETVAEKILSQENSANVLDANNNIVGSVKPSKIIQTVFRTGKEKS